MKPKPYPLEFVWEAEEHGLQECHPHRVIKKDRMAYFVDADRFDQAEWDRLCERNDSGEWRSDIPSFVRLKRQDLRSEHGAWTYFPNLFPPKHAHFFLTREAAEKWLAETRERDEEIRRREKEGRDWINRFFPAPGHRPSCAVLLDIPWPCDEDTIKVAYRKKALLHHPDTGGNEEEFRQIETAYRQAMETIDNKDIYA
jgi:hypothetical protein